MCIRDRAYDEINQWNQTPGNQVIRALVLYRWANHDHFVIETKNGAKEDFKQALSAGYKWPQRPVADDPWAALRKRLGDLEAQVAKPVSYTHLRAHETVLDLVCRLLLENKNDQNKQKLISNSTTNI
mgnify:CR=1 FL=1